jgi:hypothetical protein
LANFKGGRIIRPRFEISGQNIQPHFWVTRLWSLADFGAAEISGPDLKYPAEISGHTSG